MNLNIQEKFISKNRPYTPLVIRGGVIHETANPDDTAEMEYQYFNTGDRQASAHAFIDDTSIIQTIPFDEVAWHAGRTANRQFVGIEMCHTSNPIKFQNIWDSAILLFTHIFTKVVNPPIYTVTKNNLMSHAEVSEMWKETDHMDPVDYFKQFDRTVDDFRRDVQASIDSTLIYKALYCNKLIKSPDYWIRNLGGTLRGEWVAQVILNFVAMFKTVDTFEQAINYLVKASIISSPDYWIKNATAGGTVDGKFFQLLLIGFGKQI